MAEGLTSVLLSKNNVWGHQQTSKREGGLGLTAQPIYWNKAEQCDPGHDMQRKRDLRKSYSPYIPGYHYTHVHVHTHTHTPLHIHIHSLWSLQ